METTIEPAQRIQEAHGLWELQIARLSAIAEIAGLSGELPTRLLREASIAERDAFDNWQRVSRECGA